MKKIITLVFLTAFLSVSCQTIKPLGNDHLGDISGFYYKDINNELNPFVGTWQGTVDNKNYIFQLVRLNQVQLSNLKNQNYYQDLIVCKLKVIDTNTVLYDDTNINNFSDYKIRSIGKPVKGLFSLMYIDTLNCSNMVIFTIRSKKYNPNQFDYLDLSYEFFTKSTCPYQNQKDIPLFLPKNPVTFTKQ